MARFPHPADSEAAYLFRKFWLRLKAAWPHHPVCLATFALFACCSVNAADLPNGTLLFENLRKLNSSFRVDNPDVIASSSPDGPKGLACADLDGDGWNDLVAANADGTVAVLFGNQNGFETVRHLTAGNSRGLRDIIIANVMGDLRPEIIAAHPFEGKLYIFSVDGGSGSRTFSPPIEVLSWPGARSVVAGDFNGDGNTDLAVGGPGQGLQEFRGDGKGGFLRLPSIKALNAPPFKGDSAKPVFTMHVWRHPGETADQLTVSYAKAGRIWFLKSQLPNAPLTVLSSLTLLREESVYDLTMGYISPESRVSGEPDLITAVTLSGEVFIRHFVNASDLTRGYQSAPQQRLAIPGAPRALSVSDVNGDGWPDLLVAARAGHTLFLFRNNNGNLVLSSQTPAGSSPRDVISADFDSNGFPDAAVINRESQDVTIHRIDPTQSEFLQSPLIQRIPGGAAVPAIQDVDGDGRNELLYLTPATGEANIQKLEVDTWLPPLRYRMGERPRTLITADINGDRRVDLLCTSLGGTGSAQTGGLSYRLQQPDHTFGPLVEVTGAQGGAMLSEIARDFNGDGRLDRVALYRDSRIAFFEGTATGFENRRTEYFITEARTLAAVDLDQDGDLDLVGVGAYGDLGIIENDGRWFTRGPYRKTTFTVDKPISGIYAASAEDTNGDGYTDLALFSRNALTRWKGAPGLTFEYVDTVTLPTTLDVTEVDFDGDGIKDVFALRPANTTASFFKGTINDSTPWWLQKSEPYAVPSVKKLAFGDLDGDGRPDLIGVGEYIWAALSGTPMPPLVPTSTPQPPIEVPKVIINEVLATTSSSSKFIPPGALAPVDCVEVFNGTSAPVDLGDWKLRRLEAPGEGSTPYYIFPSITIPPRGLFIVYCAEKSGAEKVPSERRARFNLPEQGATLQLLDATGNESDRLSYPPQQEDTSYARLFDGSRNFVYNPFPSIGSTNYDNGYAQPAISFKGIDLALIKEGTWRFRARAFAASGMSTVLISWREITSSGSPRTGTIRLFDDGMHEDQANSDGFYVGDWDSPLPPGTPIEFFVTATDLNDQRSTEPDGAQFTPPDQPIENFTLALPAVSSGWEISEVVSRNDTGLKDERGKTSDWVELRYTGLLTTSIQDLYLSDSLFGYEDDKLYELSRFNSTALPGTAAVIFLDGTPVNEDEPRHAPFKVGGDGDSIYLIRRLPSGVTELVDGVKVPILDSDVAYARLGVGGPFVQTKPTPGKPNAPAGGALYMMPSSAGTPECLFVFPGRKSVEASSDLQTWTTVLPMVPDNYFEHTYREPMKGPSRFFRTR